LSGIDSVDQARSVHLAELALEFASLLFRATSQLSVTANHDTESFVVEGDTSAQAHRQCARIASRENFHCRQQADLDE